MDPNATLAQIRRLARDPNADADTLRELVLALDEWLSSKKGTLPVDWSHHHGRRDHAAR